MDDSPWPYVVLSVTMFLMGCGAGIGVGIRYERSVATEAGIAEWRVDAKTGQTTFHYLSKE